MANSYIMVLALFEHHVTLADADVFQDDRMVVFYFNENPGFVFVANFERRPCSLIISLTKVLIGKYFSFAIESNSSVPNLTSIVAESVLLGGAYLVRVVSPDAVFYE
ncbi:hypothetical protein B0T24DRAFT_632340 [Lasiosphaeria ovina]|uniref:Uncharacterized protein n=1 Tax=Lasiosphaeria ovina TaxID=92902 RepID=A0AAE0N3Z0_9PEZI|nr:hypothetical protein B0T24DRAFT_632340 [Lasiosphaeria ovina]